MFRDNLHVEEIGEQGGRPVYKLTDATSTPTVVEQPPPVVLTQPEPVVVNPVVVGQ